MTFKIFDGHNRHLWGDFKMMDKVSGQPKWKWLAARILGKKASPYAHFWQGRYWIHDMPPIELDQSPNQPDDNK